MVTMRNRSGLGLFLALSLTGSPTVATDDAESGRTLAKRPSSPSIAIVEEGGVISGIQTFMRIAGSNFTPRDSTTTFSYFGGGCMQRNSNVGDSWFTTDIQVPDGSEIDFLRVYYYDADATYDINAELWAFDGAGGTTLIAEADSSDSPGYGSAGSDFFSHIVDTTNQSLVVVASIQGGVGANLGLCGVRLRFQAPPQDLIFSDDFEL